jgi:hypothetical protein
VADRVGVWAVSLSAASHSYQVLSRGAVAALLYPAAAGYDSDPTAGWRRWIWWRHGVSWHCPSGQCRVLLLITVGWRSPTGRSWTMSESASGVLDDDTLSCVQDRHLVALFNGWTAPSILLLAAAAAAAASRRASFSLCSFRSISSCSKIHDRGLEALECRRFRVDSTAHLALWPREFIANCGTLN